MADYHAVLKRTLSAIPDPNEALRHKMYERARATITAQLDATNPPLAPETKAAQVAKLEQAILDLEAEYAPPAAVDDVAAWPEQPAAPAVAEAGPEQPVEPAAGEPGPNLATVPPEPDAPAPAPAASAATTADPLAEAFAKIDAARGEAERDGVPMEPVVATAAEPAPAEPAPAEPAAPELAASEPTPAGIDPATPDATISDAAFASAASPDVSSVSDPATSDPAALEPAVDPAAFFNDPAINEREAAALAAAPGAATVVPRRSGNVGAAALVVLLLVAGGVLASAFLFRAPILSAVGVAPDAMDTWFARVAPGLAPDDVEQPKRVPTIRIRPPAEPAEEKARVNDAVPTRAVDRPDEPKLEQRLSREGREVEPAPVREEVNTLPPPAAPVPVTTDASDGAGEVETVTVPVQTISPESMPAAPPPQPQVVEPEPADAGTEVAAVQPEAPAGQPERPAAVTADGAEIARLIEEGRSERDLVRQNGSVTWSIVQESPGEGAPEEPAIQGVMEIPERNLSMMVTIKRNTDKALSASHLMTVLFTVPDDFKGRQIENIRGVVAKPTERAQGAPMSILPAPVGQGMFFVALPSNERAVTLNTDLLRSARWFDIPVAYATGRRALFALEKGARGAKVFDEVLSVWDKAG